MGGKKVEGQRRLGTGTLGMAQAETTDANQNCPYLAKLQKIDGG